jgi:hypothetical protein
MRPMLPLYILRQVIQVEHRDPILGHVLRLLLQLSHHPGHQAAAGSVPPMRVPLEPLTYPKALGIAEKPVKSSRTKFPAGVVCTGGGVVTPPAAKGWGLPCTQRHGTA